MTQLIYTLVCTPDTVGLDVPRFKTWTAGLYEPRSGIRYTLTWNAEFRTEWLRSNIGPHLPYPAALEPCGSLVGGLVELRVTSANASVKIDEGPALALWGNEALQLWYQLRFVDPMAASFIDLVIASVTDAAGEVLDVIYALRDEGDDVLANLVDCLTVNPTPPTEHLKRGLDLA